MALPLPVSPIPWLEISGGDTPWIDEDPLAWSTVQITPAGSPPFVFYCHLPKAPHSMKLDQVQAMAAGGGTIVPRGRKSAEVSITLSLPSDAHRLLFKQMIPLLMVNSPRKLPKRVLVEHPTLRDNGINRYLYYAGSSGYERDKKEGPLTVTLRWQEDLETLKGSQTPSLDSTAGAGDLAPPVVPPASPDGAAYGALPPSQNLQNSLPA